LLKKSEELHKSKDRKNPGKKNSQKQKSSPEQTATQIKN